ncbi:MAG: hypothetical protein M3Y07_18265, partial [Acidobacteriota bacterium]|nr:hypothetical protein [Acidobacteriota bacterium]
EARAPTSKSPRRFRAAFFCHALTEEEKGWAGSAVHYTLGTLLGAYYGALYGALVETARPFRGGIVQAIVGKSGVFARLRVGLPSCLWDRVGMCQADDA